MPDSATEYAKLLTSTTSLLTWYASYSTSLMLLKNTYRQVVPERVQSFVASTIAGYFSHKKQDPSYITLIIDDYSWDSFDDNELVKAVEYYLSSKIGPKDEVVRMAKFDYDEKKSLTKGLVADTQIFDIFEDIEVSWKYVCTEKKEEGTESISNCDSYYAMKFEEKYREKVLNEYLGDIQKKYDTYLEKEKTLQLYTRRARGGWFRMDFEHPCTFDTLAMDCELKKAIMDDLDKFKKSKEFYGRIGKAWKRGYLFYGPPGTGKSSLIAAIAKHLNYDVYDLQLESIDSDSELRSALLYTEQKSMVVIEDIDCNSEVHSRSNSKSKNSSSFSLSSLLNCIDGLWSSCGEERVIVFTTNRKEVLDPALLRPGRMDMHIHMSYCTTQGFRVLAKNYLGIQDHQLFEEIDGLMQIVEVTPASLAEELMKSEDADVALGEVVNFLKQKKAEKEKYEEENQEKENTEEINASEEENKGLFGNVVLHGAVTVVLCCTGMFGAVLWGKSIVFKLGRRSDLDKSSGYRIKGQPVGSPTGQSFAINNFF